jgi:hypothetical protein
MKRFIVAALIAASMTSPAHAEGKGPCTGWFSNIRPSLGIARVHHRVEHLIDCAVRIWPVPGGTFYARAIAERESHMWPWAYNPSGCAGLFQQMLRYWPGRRATYWNRSWFWKVPSAFNARANVIVSIRMAHVGGWRPWGG